MRINCAEMPVRERQYWLQALIGPRPIALVSTVDSKGRVNLAPFSFFNVFSAEPPIVVFSPCRSIRTGEHKDTLLNLLEVPECVISIVDYTILERVNTCSAMYEHGINEFIVAGFTPIPSQTVKPPQVKESKANLECSVIEIKSLGNKGGAGNLVICEVMELHVSSDLINQMGRLEQTKLDHVGRLGGDWYVKINAANLFELPKP